jgi:hypothetical protein
MARIYMGKRRGQSVWIRSMILKKPAHGLLHIWVQRHCQGVRYFRNFIGYNGETPKCNFVYVPKKSMVFTAPIFTKCTNAQHHCVHMAYTEFHPNRSINAKSLERNSSEPLSKVRLSLRRFSWNSLSFNDFCSYFRCQMFSKSDYKHVVNWSKFHTEDPQILGATVQNLVAIDQCTPWFTMRFISFHTLRSVIPIINRFIFSINHTYHCMFLNTLLNVLRPDSLEVLLHI